MKLMPELFEMRTSDTYIIQGEYSETADRS